MTTMLAPATTLETVSSVPGMLRQQAQERGDAVALRRKALGRWRQYSWADYWGHVAAAGVGLLDLGVEPGDRVAIHAENRPEWVFADVGAQGIGAISVGVYPTSSATELHYLLDHSGTKVLITEDEEQLDKVLAVRDQLPDLHHIVLIDPLGVGREVLDDPQVLTWEQLVERGRQRGGGDGPTTEFDQCVDRIRPDEPAIIVYTSGTTGPPKGAVLAHANLLATARVTAQVWDLGPADELLSYLPLCHVAERLLSVVCALGLAYVVNFGEGTESLDVDLQEVQPTIYLGVPRMWEKLLARVEIRMRDATWLKRGAYRLALRMGHGVARHRMKGRFPPLQRVVFAVWWLLLYRPLLDKLGLRRVRLAMSGAAPIAPQVLDYFWALGVPILEAYGQTENSGICTNMPRDDVRIGTVGVPLPGVELRFGDDGEIITRSEGVFQGYFRDDAATAATVDADGWLHSGDIGEMDADGYVRITGRKKDIIITAGGKNIAPSEIENRLKVSPYIKEAVVIGDRRRYLTALIGIELDTVGDWATRQRISFTTYEDLSAKPEVRQLITDAVDEANEDFARVEQIKDFRLFPKELDHEEGELTATQKVKRSAVQEQFHDLIEEMYA